jgi:hypothetical protein
MRRKSRPREESSLAEDTRLPRRGRLPVLAMLTVAPLMALVGGVLAASSGPGSQSAWTPADCVFALDEGRFRTMAFPFPADPEDSLVGIDDRGLIVGGYIDTEGSHSYVRDRRGRFTTIDVSGAAASWSYDLYGDTEPRATPRRAVRAAACGRRL